MLQLFQNILTSTELQFPPEALKELHSDCLDLCRSLLRQNPGTDGMYICAYLICCIIAGGDESEVEYNYTYVLNDILMWRTSVKFDFNVQLSD